MRTVESCKYVPESTRYWVNWDNLKVPRWVAHCVLELIDTHDTNLTDLSSLLGFQDPSSLSHALKGRRSLGSDKLNRLRQLYIELNGNEDPNTNGSAPTEEQSHANGTQEATEIQQPQAWASPLTGSLDCLDAYFERLREADKALQKAIDSAIPAAKYGLNELRSRHETYYQDALEFLGRS